MQKKYQSLLIRFSIAIAIVCISAIVWASYRGQKKMSVSPTVAAAEWSVVDADPWQEMNKIIYSMEQAFPFIQDGSVLLRDENGKIIEKKDFHADYYDSVTLHYSLAQVEMLHTPKWEAIIDHDQNMIALSRVAKAKNTAGAGSFDIIKLRAMFESGQFGWKVLQNNDGMRALYSEDFASGSLSGMRIQYQPSSYSLVSVQMGLPKFVSTEDTVAHPLGIEAVTESLEMNYLPIRSMNEEGRQQHPEKYIQVKGGKAVVLKAKLADYRIINHIQ
jgi:hypothetical protein